MTLSISDTSITSDLSKHSAKLVDENNPESGWEVSWMPDTTLSKQEATTAMLIADEVAKGRDDHSTTNFSRARWALIRDWCREIDVMPLRALKILEEWGPDGKRTIP